MSDAVNFEFVCEGLAPDTFAVNQWQGEESLSRLYRYEIELRSRNFDLDLDQSINRLCTFRMAVGDHRREVKGILCELDFQQAASEFAVYRAVLVPRLWQLSLYETNEIYLDLTVPEMIRQVLERGGFTSLDFRLDLTRNYRRWPYRCQYGETNWNFLNRIMEREGIYYFFEPGEHGEVLVILDHQQFHPRIPSPQLDFAVPSGLDADKFGDSVFSLVCRQRRVAQKVTLRDYNDETPSVELKGQAQVDPNGVGEINVFGQNIVTPEEGKELAAVWAERVGWERQVFYGESTVQRLVPGSLFTLDRHFRKAFNQSYLIVSVSHGGIDPAMASFAAEGGTPPDAYQNSFTAIAADIQYRPLMQTERPQIHGNLDAVIDAEGDGHYAELDSQGRYKVVMPFDREIRDEGKASYWIRMSQSFAGEQDGMHFPLRKGAHVLLSFIGGDPDRPVITGAMPNASQPSVVTADNQTKSKIQTRAGNLMEMEDRDDKKRIKLYTPHKRSYMHLGAANHPGSGVVVLSQGIERREIGGGFRLTTGVNNPAKPGSYTNYIVSSPADDTDGTGADAYAESKDILDESEMTSFKLKDDEGKTVNSTHPDFATANESSEKTPKQGYVQNDGTLTRDGELSGKWLFERRSGDYYIWTEGNTYSYGGGNEFNFGNSYSETHVSEDGIDKNKEVWNVPTVTNLTFDANNAQVEKVWSDTFSYACGNNYSWGDTCDYEFGNGYTEAIINDPDNHGINYSGWPMDKCPPGTSTTSSIGGNDITLDMNNTAVEKTIGDTYDYHSGNTIEVNVGSTETHEKGSSYEYKYAASGQLTHKEWSHAGVHKEWAWHPDTGGLISYEQSTGGGTAKFETTFIPSISMSIDLSQLSTSVEISLASETKTSISYAPLSLVTQIEGTLVDIETKIELPGYIEIKSEFSDGKFKVKTAEGPVGAHLEEKAAEFKAEQQMELVQKVMTIMDKEAQILESIVDINSGEISLTDAMLKIFG